MPTISQLEAINPQWISQHKMHHGTGISRFYQIASGEIQPYRLLSMYAKDGKKVISSLIFEKYPDTACNWGSLQCKNSVYLMRGVGRVGIYTLPEYRRQGLAHKLVEEFIREITKTYENLGKSNEDYVKVLAHQFDIAEFFTPLLKIKNWFPTRTAVGRNLWAEQLKEAIKRNKISPPDSVSLKYAIQTLIKKGWGIKPYKKGVCLYNEYENPDWGKLTSIGPYLKLPKKMQSIGESQKTLISY